MGTLRQALRDLGVAENTLLWFNSDNGAMIGSTGGLSEADTENFVGEAVWMDNRHKLHVSGGRPRLYDLVADPAEQHNLADEKPEVVEQMRRELTDWQASVERSLAGQDYEAQRATQPVR